MKIFIDTSAFMAFILKDESFHNQVVAKYEEYKQKRTQLITSDFALDEIFTLDRDFKRMRLTVSSFS